MRLGFDPKTNLSDLVLGTWCRLTETQGNPGLHVILALPHADGSATTVVVAPRSRLVAQDPFGAFLGFTPPPAPEPPYLLRIGDAAPESGEANPSGRGRWTRIANELHGDWEVPSTGGCRAVCTRWWTCGRLTRW